MTDKPSSSTWQILISIVCFATIITSVLQWITFPTEILAGSIQLINGRLINSGAIIHQDFWSKETPLVFYLNSWAFKLFGESVVSAKIVALIIYLLVIIGFYIYYRRAEKYSNLTIILLTLITAYLTLFNLLQTKWVAYAIAYLAYLIYLISQQAQGKQSDRLLILGGITTGLAILAKINCGTYIFIGICLGLLNELLFSQNKKSELKKLIYFCLPIVACLGLYLLAHLDHLSQLIEQVIVFPGRDLGEHRIISLAYRDDRFLNQLADFVSIYLTATFPLIWFHLQLVKQRQKLGGKTFFPLSLAIAILPILLVAEFQAPNLLPKLFIFPLIGIIICQVSVNRIAGEQFTTICTYSLFLHYFFSRSDNSHYAPLVFLAIVLIFGELLQHQGVKFPKLYPKLYFLLCWSFLAYSQLSVPWQEIKAHFWTFEQIATSGQVFQLKTTLMAQGDTNFLMSARLPLTSPVAKLYADQDELAALQLVHQQTNENDYVYIGVTDHARIYISNLKPYWILDRKIPVTNYSLEPGLTTEKSVQQKMITQLKDKQVGWIVLWQQPEAEADFLGRNYLGSNLLNRYIRQNYTLVQKFGAYEVYNN